MSEYNDLNPFQGVDWNAIREVIKETNALLATGTQSPAAREASLRRRAEQIAAVPTERTRREDVITVLTFKLQAERYALPVQVVRAISTLQRITPVPCVPSHYLGVTNLQGKIISVLDLLVLFGVEPAPTTTTSSQRLIVATGAGLEIGIIADEVTAVTELDIKSLINSQSIADDWLDAVSAITVDGIIVLDSEQLFRDPRLHIHEETR